VVRQAAGSVAVRPSVRVEGLHHCYPDGVLALRGVELEVAAGERVGIVGPNGAGKTTLLRHLNGLLHPTRGEVWIAGLRVTPAACPEVRRQVGYVFQDADDQLFCPTVYDDVAFGPSHLGLPAAEVDARVRQALAVVGLTGFEERVPQKLSAGQKRLVALAGVLSYDPSILVLDEPSAALDPRHRRRLINLLKGLDRTLIVATHDLDFVWDVCTRTVLLDAGHVHADGPTRTILGDRALLETNGLELPLRLQGGGQPDA